jgi:hypothetical protein
MSITSMPFERILWRLAKDELEELDEVGELDCDSDGRETEDRGVQMGSADCDDDDEDIVIVVDGIGKRCYCR